MVAQKGEDWPEVHARIQVSCSLLIFPAHERCFLRKPRKDRRKGEKFTGAQGSDQGKSDSYDYSNRVTDAKEAAAKVTLQ